MPSITGKNTKPSPYLRKILIKIVQYLEVIYQMTISKFVFLADSDQ